MARRAYSGANEGNDALSPGRRVRSRLRLCAMPTAKPLFARGRRPSQPGTRRPRCQGPRLAPTG
eukprot:8238751-Alexandrium_andersonii.AAC.1